MRRRRVLRSESGLGVLSCEEHEERPLLSFVSFLSP
jgi:hypothetical protein